MLKVKVIPSSGYIEIHFLGEGGGVDWYKRVQNHTLCFLTVSGIKTLLRPCCLIPSSTALSPPLPPCNLKIYACSLFIFFNVAPILPFLLGGLSGEFENACTLSKVRGMGDAKSQTYKAISFSLPPLYGKHILSLQRCMWKIKLGVHNFCVMWIVWGDLLPSPSFFFSWRFSHRQEQRSH